MAARTTAVVSFAICFILGVDRSSRGAVANGGSWGGCIDNGGSCGVVLKLSNRFFGALAGARFFFGFRPRLLGIAKQWVGTDQVTRISYWLLANALISRRPARLQCLCNHEPPPKSSLIVSSNKRISTQNYRDGRKDKLPNMCARRPAARNRPRAGGM
jgi:hypothetical protein